MHVEYIPGNTNLIFSVPHDGSINLTSIPVRRNGCKDAEDVCLYPGKDDCHPEKICKVITGADLNAKVITRTVYDKYVESTGKYPHLIISHLHRSMLDPNRPVEQAAQGNDEAIAAYEAFHGSIKHAHAALGGEPGLHIDFHGYTDIYRQNSTMIGYLFNSQDLNSGQTDIKKSSIQALIGRTGLPVQQFLFGEKSLGSMFESAGYKAVPSPRQPYPGQDKYYRGGWITQIHGSRDGGVIDAIQLEFPTEIRTEATDEERFRFGVKLAENIETFQSLYYN
eukprot:TRINITY_DN25571_c0_g1_i1.p1 TRINITY_DN25571_c0_g1~~TRINITY_DN25571_c0_g1_i1.p1  ORF type:complete len:317 (-),score=83.23 TRINITY_DN25571_c0_g1_i1:111-950(-)